MAGRTSDGKLLGVCETPTLDNTITVGVVKDSCCYYVYNGEANATVFEVLTGTGFQWMNRPTSVTTIPTNAFEAGMDSNKPEYVGRCNIRTDTFVGKIWDVTNFHYGYNGEEMKDCLNPDILLCDQGASG